MLIVFVLFAALSARAVPGVCTFKASCPYRCCRGIATNPTCLCSYCCMTQEFELGPDDRSQDAVDGSRTAKVFRHRVEFFKGGESKPRIVRAFEEGIHPIDASAGGGGLLLICTSAELGVVKSTGAEKGFCGALRMDGREAFRLRDVEIPGVSREPIGVAAGGKEALFALTKARKDGDREIVGYRLWAKGRPSELLEPDGPRTRKILEKYEGLLVLPNPLQGD